MDTIKIKKVDGYPAVEPRLENIPDFLKAMPWAVWTAEPRKGQPGKFDKAPRSPVTGAGIGTDKPELFGTFEQARNALKTGKYSGFGVLLTGEEVTGIDIDARANTLANNPSVKQLVLDAKERGAYLESSPSDDGIRGFMRGKLPAGSRKKSGPLELYDNVRFLTVTGKRLKGCGDTLVDGQVLIDRFAALLGTSTKQPKHEVILAGPEASPELVSTLCTLMAEKEPRLWGGDWMQVQTAFGPIGYTSQNDADLALCGAIARHAVQLGTQDDILPATIKAVFEKSGLVRDKWLSRDYYQKRTIGNVVSDIVATRGAAEVITQSPVGSEFAQAEPGDIMAGRLYARLMRGKYRFVTQINKWMRWGDTRWAWCDCGEEMAAAKEIADRTLEWSVTLARQDADKHKKRLAFALRLQNLPRLEAMVSLAKSEDGMSIGHMTELDSDPWLLGVRNGVVNLKTGGLLAPDPDMLITRQAAADYNPEAECPVWLEFLNSIFEGDTETIRYIQRALGYSLTGVTSEEVLFVNYGFGANGKSVLANTVQAILNDYAQAAPPSLLTVRRDGDAGPRNDIARLCGARLVQINELQQGDRLDEQVVKVLAGREMLSARYLHKEFFDFWPTAKPWLRTNHRPVVTGDDDGIWRRLHLIPYRRKFTEEECDNNLEQKLLDERDGILAWMVKGCLEWKRGGGLKPSPTVKRESATYRKESDLLGEFLEEQTAVVPDGRVEQQKLFTEWRNWNEGNGTRYGSKASFTRKLSERGHGEARSNGTRYYQGLVIRQVRNQ